MKKSMVLARKRNADHVPVKRCFSINCFFTWDWPCSTGIHGEWREMDSVSHRLMRLSSWGELAGEAMVWCYRCINWWTDASGLQFLFLPKYNTCPYEQVFMQQGDGWMPWCPLPLLSQCAAQHPAGMQRAVSKKLMLNASDENKPVSSLILIS